jgi:hypothetical protein
MNTLAPFHAPSARLPIIAPHKKTYNAHAYREMLALYNLASKRLSDPESEREASRLNNLTDEERAIEFPLYK